MPYIPPAHEKYDILPYCRENGGEVFCYDAFLEDKIREMMPEIEHLIPYGYNSYEEFYDLLDEYIRRYGTVDGQLNELGKLIEEYKEDIKKSNVKEDWSIVRYIGKTTISFTQGRYYYWPCTADDPEFSGIIDDEEFTTYAGWELDSAPQIEYGVFGRCWEIAEDPTGMAKKELDKDKNLSE